MRCRVALYPYLNLRPFFLVPLPNGMERSLLTPRQIVQGLARREIDAGPAPVGALLELGNLVTPVADYGLAAGQEAQSVLFFSNLPMSQLSEHSRLSLGEESSSSVRLLFLLLLEMLGPDHLPRAAQPGEQVDGALLIGDSALASLATPQYPFCEDLALLWQKRTGLPFVFARWVVGRWTTPACRAGLAQWLAACVDNVADLAHRAAWDYPLPAGISIAKAQEYLALFQYRFGPAELQGEGLFLKLFARHQHMYHRFANLVGAP